MVDQGRTYDVLNKVESLLMKHGISFEKTLHAEVHTASEAEAVLGHASSEGTKSVIFEGKAGVYVVTVAGDERIDIGLLKERLNERRLKMASEETLAALSLERGDASPFGYPEHVRLIVSPALFERKVVYITPGRNDVTIKMSGNAFRKLVEGCNFLTLHGSWVTKLQP